MEEIAVAKPVGCRCRCRCGGLPSCGCDCAYGCSDKSRAARRRRMEIRRFKLVAANAAAALSGPSNKKPKLNATPCCCRTAEEVEEEEEEAEEENQRALTEKVTESVSSSPPLVLTLRNEDGERCPQHGVVSICGGRLFMEDAVRIVPSFVAGADGVYHFFGVFDGHGGSQAAMHCMERLHEALANEIRLTDPVNETEWKAAMKACFLKMDVEVAGVCGGNEKLKRQGIESQGEEKIEAKAPETVGSTVGSTAVVAVVSSRQIVVANCGDSRAVLSRGGKAIPLSTDHKPEAPEEMARIEAAGGRVIYWNGYRVLGVLAMSRAIGCGSEVFETAGDKYLKPYVIAEPELSFEERSEEDECLILASDGLWDVVSNEVACELSRKCLSFHGSRRTAQVDGTCPRADPVFESPAATAAALLTKLAVARGSADNISVIVVDLRKPCSTM